MCVLQIGSNDVSLLNDEVPASKELYLKIKKILNKNETTTQTSNEDEIYLVAAMEYKHKSAHSTINATRNIAHTLKATHEISVVFVELDSESTVDEWKNVIPEIDCSVHCCTMLGVYTR